MGNIHNILISTSILQPSSEEDFSPLITINKNNFVAASVLARDKSRGIDFDFSLHINFPTVKLSWVQWNNPTLNLSFKPVAFRQEVEHFWFNWKYCGETKAWQRIKWKQFLAIIDCWVSLKYWVLLWVVIVTVPLVQPVRSCLVCRVQWEGDLVSPVTWYYITTLSWLEAGGLAGSGDSQHWTF